MLMAALYTLDRMNGDSELIVMTASGAPVWRIGSSLLLMSGLVCLGIFLANVFVTPASMRELRTFVTQVRADLISQVLQPGRFSSPEGGLTFHIRDRSPNGDLLGLLVHDERDPKQVMSYLAERGRIIIYKAMCDLLWALWGLIQHANSNPVDDFWAYSIGRFERCRTLMASADFGRHVENVRRGESMPQPAPGSQAP